MRESGLLDWDRSNPAVCSDTTRTPLLHAAYWQYGEQCPKSYIACVISYFRFELVFFAYINIKIFLKQAEFTREAPLHKLLRLYSSNVDL